MSDTQYVYAVARIRSKEMQLFNAQTVEQLLSAKSYDECMHLLQEKGWGADESDPSTESLLSAERAKTWALIGELVADMSVFDVFLYANDYHNLKAAIKLVCTNSPDFGAFISQSTIDPQQIMSAVREHDFPLLPEAMRAPAEEAYTALAQTHDGQLCDIIVDKAALEAIHRAGNASKNEIIKKYAELTVVSANMKTAVRCNKTGKNLEFIKRALSECDTLDVSRLARAASENMDSIYEFLSMTDYAESVSALKQSLSAFERWCDNMLIVSIRPQQFNPFGLGPLAAYILGRENEIKIVRIILAGKLNGLSEPAIRERMREMYV